MPSVVGGRPQRSQIVPGGGFGWAALSFLRSACGSVVHPLQRLATPSLTLIAEGGHDYWERRFDAEEKYDWYCSWDAIERTVLDTLAGVDSDGKPTV